MTDDPIVELASIVTLTLEKLGIEYALTGSVASGFHGEPVVSLDLDFIVKMTPQQAKRLAQDLPARFYRSEDALVQAAKTYGMANLIDSATPMKIDLSVMPPSPFRDAIFARKTCCGLAPEADPIQTVSPEDIVLMKVEWQKDTRSQKQWDNALSVVRRHGPRLDWTYMFEQAKALSVEEDLIKLRDEAGV